MTIGTPCIFLKAGEWMTLARRKEGDTFDERFSRLHKTLHFIACRILADRETAAFAVESCRRKASQNSSGFESEGAFHSWILRLLIDEALSILRPGQFEALEGPEASPASATNKTKRGGR
jgi:DNA-directed RNA polymerase specialized sigma24 family protein